MLKIALGQMSVRPGRPDINCRTIIDHIATARAAGCDLVVFPELAIPGYLLGDTWEQDAFVRDCEYWGQQVIAASRGITVVFGNVAADWRQRGDDGRTRKYNAAFIACDGRLHQNPCWPYPFYIKTLQPNYREFDDNRHFFSLRKLAAELNLDLAGLFAPVTVDASRRLKLVVTICEDGWDDNYTLKPFSLIANQPDADCLINISCSPYSLDKNRARHRLFAGHAANKGRPLVYVNASGLQNNGKTVYCLDGSSAVFDPDGRNLWAAPSFADGLFFSDRLPSSGLQTGSDSIDSVYRCLHHGLRQLLPSLAVERVVIGASGGIDSAVAAAMYGTVLPPDRLLLVNMPSRFNSPTTRGLAARLAANLGCHYAVVPVGRSLSHTVHQIERTPIVSPGGRQPLKLQVGGLTRENIQARDRSGRILAGYASAWQAVFTCNANKTETTVGYSTLYGDHAGFFALLADLWKFQIYQLAEYLNREVYQRELIPSGSMTIVPSAELSAAQNVDRGQGDPLIYPYHDFLFRAFVERWQRATPEDIASWYLDGRLEEEIGCRPGLTGEIFPDPAAFIADLERWWRAYCGMAVAKRIQAPPVMAVSRRPFGYDHREAQNQVYFTHGYLELKQKILSRPRPGHSAG
ncbi:MAG: NAD(+) synthase [Negativicutes bacterium]|nr:NAD(+) synthase [Negativicutes bacterium]